MEANATRKGFLSITTRVFKAKQLGTCHKNITDSLPWYKIKYTIFILYIIKNKELGQRGHLWNFVNYAGSKKKKKRPKCL